MPDIRIDWTDPETDAPYGEKLCPDCFTEHLPTDCHAPKPNPLAAFLTVADRILSLAYTCARCEGEGLEHGEACGTCGGIGEVCQAGPELHLLRAAVKTARGEG